MIQSSTRSRCTSGISTPRFGNTALLIAAFALLFAQAGGQAASGDALPYSKGFLVTGNYVVGGVDLTPQANPADVNGYATGTITISDTALAGGANLVAAYLYFEAVHPYPIASDDANPVVGIKFRNTPIDPAAMRVATKPLSSGGANCWGSAGQGSFAVSTYRANVLSLLPKQFDLQGKWTGKYIVNSAELPGNGQLTVTMREKTGDSAIQTAGATLFLVHRNLSPTEPLRKIVVYDGLYTAYDIGVSSSTAEADTMTQRIRGFYKSAGTSARITHVVGTGGNNQTEKITVTSQSNNTITLGPPPNSADPFPQTSPSSDRSWANPTYDLGKTGPAFMPGTTNPADRYGETVTTTVSANNSNPAACRAWTAVFFSTEVADADHDGLPDGLEDAPGGLKDPNDAELPNLNKMGAASTHKDLFAEFNAMWAGDNPFTTADEGLTTTYGSLAAPYPNTTAACYDPVNKSCTDSAGHHHFLTPEDVKRVGDRFKANNIAFHLDVGSVSAYHGLGVVQHTDWVDDYTSTVADEYFVGNGVGTNVASLARGGEVVKEVACNSADPQCHFPDYPGTEGWKIGLLAHRNAPVGDDGQELNSDLTDPNDPAFSWTNSQEHRLRFDRERRPYFHYALSAHTRGTPSSPFPCLVNGQPADYPPNSTTCAETDNPESHVPSGSRGLSDLNGRNILLALGLWDEFVGRPFARQGGLFHEFGHNMSLWHSGRPADFGNATTSTVIYPNCSPIFLSSMSYLYSIHGLFDSNGNIQLDYSGQVLTPSLAENGLSDGAYSTTPAYQRAWYAPAGSALALDEGVQAATRFCSGVQFGPGQPVQQMARVLSDTYNQQSGTWYIDWDGDHQVDALSPPQDANFDGVVDQTSSFSQTFSGFNDWAKIRLDQISAGGLGGGIEDFMLVASPAADDLIVFGGDDLINFGGDDLIVFGGDDLVSFGGDDLIVLAGDVQPEPTYAGAKGLGRTAPYGVTACNVGTPGCFETTQPFTPQYHRVAVSWQASAMVGHVAFYQVQWKRGDVPNNWMEAGTTPTNHLIHEAVLPNLLPIIYRVRAHFDDPPAMSAWAYLLVPTLFQALNDPPDGRADSYVTPKSGPNSFTVPAPGVLGVSCTSNAQCTPGTPGTDADRSSDNPTAYVARRAVLVSGPVIRGTNTPIGTLVFNTNGGFTFSSFPSNFTGFVTFQYKANDGPWSVDPNVSMNRDGQGNELFSGPMTVTIQVRK